MVTTTELWTWCWDSFQRSPLLVQGLFTVLAVLVVGLPVRRWYRWMMGRHIAGIPRFFSPPILGMAYQRSNKHHFHRLAMLDGKGPLVQYYVFSAHIVLVGDGKLAKYVLEQVKTKGSIMQRGFWKSNIFSLDTNNDWKLRRNSFRHAFTSSSLKHFEGSMEQICNQLCLKLDTNAASKKTLQIGHLFGRMTLDMLFTIGFDCPMDFLDKPEVYEELNEAIQLYFKVSWIASLPSFNLFTPMKVPIKAYQQYNSAIGIIRKYQDELLTRIKAKYEQNSLSSNSFSKILLDFAKENNLSDDEILSELFIFIIAGHETTAHSLEWLVYSLVKNPHIQQKCQEVADATWPAGSASGNGSQVLPEYLEAVIKESMRKYPTAGRGSIRQVQLEEGLTLDTSHLNDLQPADKKHTWSHVYPKQIYIPKGSFVNVNYYALHNLTSIWGENANDFVPERWLSAQHPSLQSLAAFGGVGFDADSLTFAPFAYGVRNCVGMNMAMLEIRATFKHLLLNYHFEIADRSLLDEHKVIVTDLTMKPLDSLPVLVSRRKH